MSIHVVLIIAYILMIASIGILSSKKVKGVSEFFLGGRSVNPWMSAFSYGTAYFSAVIFIGYAGKIGWNFGISALWMVLGNTLVGSYLAWHVLGKKTREMTHRLDVATMPQFIEKRYRSKALKIVTAVIIFVFLIPYSASVYKGLGYLFEEIFHIPNQYALLLMTILTAFYLFFGGFVAATLADFIQGIIMVIGVVLLLFFILNNPSVEGMLAIQNLREISPPLANPFTGSYMLPVMSLVILTSLGSWGLPQMVHKFYTIKGEKYIFSAKWVSTGFALLITFGAYFTGAMSRIFFPEEMPAINGVPNPDMIIPQMIGSLLPNWVSAILLVLVLSASMSTLASLVLASSSAISLDLIEGTILPDINKDRLMIFTRVLCVVFVVASFFLAILPNPILSLAALSWGAVSGCLLAPYLLGLYWKGVTKAGVWAGIITALTIVIGGALKYGLDSSQIPMIGAAAICLPLIVVPVISLVTKAFDMEHLKYIYNQEQPVGGEEV